MPQSSRRASRSPRSVRALVCVAFYGLAGCGGIGISSTAGSDSSSFQDGGVASSTTTGTAGSSDTAASDASVSAISSDAGAGAAPTASNSTSSLCGDESACDPDLVTSNGCDAPIAADAGSSDAGKSSGDDDDSDAGSSGSGGYGGTACRVTSEGATSTSSSVVAVCQSAGRGGDGVACTTSTDCSAGYECIGTPGVCRRYCCSGSCSNDTMFCDIQPVAGATNVTSALSVPACVPITACKLLMPSSCTSGFTCGIVSESGTTSCLAIGAAAEGDSCESTHCAADLVCLGQKGSRRCEKLCHVDGTDCATTQTCTASQMFDDPNIGVCQTSTSK